MPKIYSELDKRNIKKNLLKIGLTLLCEKGYKSIRVEEITQRVGVSKSLFYSLFSSKEEFVLQALIEQQSTFYELISTEMSRENYPIEERIFRFLKICFENEDKRFLYLKQKEQVDIVAHLSPESYELFQQEQRRFYRKIAMLMQAGRDNCDSELLGNITMIVLLLFNSPESIPFMFQDKILDTGRFLIQMMENYLKQQLNHNSNLFR